MNESKYVFAPGCALTIYKPHLTERLHDFLNSEFGEMQRHMTCCRHEPDSLTAGTAVINVCSGCNSRYETLYEGITTVSVWKLLAESSFPFPDYKNADITVHDACPTRHKPDVHEAVRAILKKMNFNIVEAEQSGTSAFCCGDSFYTKLPKEAVIEQMKKRAGVMPASDVTVYCVSCIKSMANGGKTPRYIIDLLFEEETEPQETDPVLWHESLEKFIETH